MKFALILCIMLSQTLGLVHSVEHSQHYIKQGTIETQLHPVADQSNLFAGHDEETTCQLYDQLSMGGALVGDAIAQVHSAPEPILLAIDGHGIHTHQRSVVQARAPPAFFIVS